MQGTILPKYYITKLGSIKLPSIMMHKKFNMKLNIAHKQFDLHNQVVSSL